MKLPINLSHLDIEIVRGCFLTCRWCPLDKSGPYQFMDLDLFGKIMDEIERAGTGYHRIDLFRGGEPFLYPDIGSLLSILEGRRLSGDRTIGFFTNGMVLRREHIKAIMESALKIETVFSVDGVGTRESFEYMRSGAKWETVKGNISLLSAARRHSIYEGLKKVTVSAIIPHQQAVPFHVPQQEEIERAFKDEFGPLGIDEFYYRSIHRYNGQIIMEGMPEKEMRNGPCCFVKRGGVSILVDGRVSVCCGDLTNRLIVGDLKNQTLEEIFYGDRLSSIREMMLSGERYKLAICGTCDLR